MNEVSFRVVKEWGVVAVRIPDEARDRRDRLAGNNCCTSCERKFLDGEKVNCGQCMTCYQFVRRRVQKGLAVLNDFIRSGEMFPPGKGPRKPGRRPSNKFTQDAANR